MNRQKIRRLCSVCARAGSKGVRNKNIREIAGQPLISHTIQQARAVGLFDLIAVSSDSQAILDVAGRYGADLLIPRPSTLATDTAAKVPAIRHCVEEVERLSDIHFDTLVDLDATSPLRLVEDIAGAVELLESKQVSNVITAAPSRRSPYFHVIEIGSDGVIKRSKSLDQEIVCRQEAPACYDMNGSVYVWQHNALFEDPAIFRRDTALFVMPEERSVDIDSELDFQIVEMLLLKRMQ